MVERGLHPDSNESREEAYRRLLRLAADDQRKISWVRRDYLKHRRVINALNDRLSQDGVGLRERARQLWEAQRLSLGVAVARMNDASGRDLSESRNTFKFGDKVLPSFQFLLDTARNNRSDETGQFEAVIHWALRPDLYRYCWSESLGHSRFERLKLERQIENPPYFSKKIGWTETGNPAEPLLAKVGRKTLKLRVNECPEEALYSLLEDGIVTIDFDDWPRSWLRSSSKTEGLKGTGLKGTA